MDGVLADFDGHYFNTFGRQRVRGSGWDDIRAIPNFYRDIPPMPDMEELWTGIQHLNPVILTGIPEPELVPEAAENKRQWVDKWLGDVPVICCEAQDKSDYMKPGDIIIDDHDDWAFLWIQRGGVWIKHTNAQHTINQLKGIL